MKKQILILCLPLLLTFNANALFELRAGYGVNTPSEEPPGVSLKTMAGFNLDALVELPMVPFGFGLRYESLGMDLTVGTTTSETAMQRTSILLNYRLLDLFTYFGLIGSIGLVNDYEIKFAGAAAKYDSSLTYSIGVEGGVSLGMLMVGAELGYLSANFEQTNNPANSDIDLGGIYAKALVGVGF